MPFDIRQLRYAIAAADHGSFHRAARALDIDQSTLSRNILKLERSLGTPIFERSRAGVALTSAGTEFIRGAKPMVATANELASMMRAAGQGRAGALVLGHNCAISAGHLRATIIGWHEAYPDVEVDCVDGDRRSLLAGLDSGEIDLALLMGTATHNGYRGEMFWSERLMAALPLSHPLAGRVSVNWADLHNQRIHLPIADPGSAFRNIVLGRFSGSGRVPEIRMHRASREAILSVLGAGDGVSIVCESSVGTFYPDVTYLPLAGEQGPALVGYSGYWQADHRNPVLTRFLDFTSRRYALPFVV